jgi:hypothetical protein
MNQNISKILKGFIAIIALIAAYFFLKIISIGDDAIVAGKGTLGIVGPLVYFSKGLLYVVAGITVVFSIFSLVKKPEALKKTLISLVVLGVLLAIAYSLADDSEVIDVTGQLLKDGEAGASSKWVSTGIWYTLFLGVAAVATIILGGIKSIIK